MFWWGKVVASGVAGLIAGPFAALAAVGIGHQVDRELSGLQRALTPVLDARRRERLCWIRRTALFSLAGALAQAAALPLARRVAVIEGLMAREGLAASARSRALALFRDGERADYPLTAVVNQFRRACQRRPDLAIALISELLPLLEGLDQSAPAYRLLEDIAARLGITPRRVRRLAAAWRSASAATRAGDHQMSRQAAVQVLGVSPTASQAEIVRAYRRLLSLHHPDKLAHRHPTPEALAAAAHQTDQIRKAYRRLSRDQDG